MSSRQNLKELADKVAEFVTVAKRQRALGVSLAKLSSLVAEHSDPPPAA